MDKRVEKTKTALRNALLALLQSKPLDSITITELCKTANVNRNTLYFHYAGIHEILAEIEEQILDEMRPYLGKSDDNTADSPLTRLCRIYYQHRDTLRVIISQDCDPNFSNQALELARNSLIHAWMKTDFLSPEQSEKIYTFTVGGSMAILKNWIQSGCRESPESVAAFLNKAGASVVSTIKAQQPRISDSEQHTGKGRQNK